MARLYPIPSTPSLGLHRLKLWPSGDFSIGRIPRQRKDKGDHPLDGIWKDDALAMVRMRSRELPPVELPESDRVTLAHKLMDIADAAGDDIPRAERFALAAMAAMPPDVPPGEPAPPLGLSAMFNSRFSGESLHRKGFGGRPKGAVAVRRGSKGITPYGKRMVRSGVKLLTDRAGRFNMSFATLTVPTMSPGDHATVARSWPLLTKRLMDKMTRRLKAQGVPSDLVLVSEIQPKRWERWGVVGLHLHVVFQGRCNRWDEWAIIPSILDKFWADSLENLLGHPVNVKAANRIEVPKRSLGGELSKYMSKGCKVAAEAIAAGKGDMLPTAWWNATAQLKRDIRAGIEVWGDSRADWVLDNLEVLRSLKLTWHHHVFTRIGVNLDTGEVEQLWVGTVGGIQSDRARQQIAHWARSNADISGLTACNKPVTGIG